MDRIRHKTLRGTLLVVSDTPRKVDDDGYVCDLTEYEFAKCANIPYCFDVVTEVTEFVKVAKEDEEPDESVDAVANEDKPAPAKRGRPAGKR